jgi:hypothetical protein
MPGKQVGGVHHKCQIGSTVLCERGRHADDRGIAALQKLKIASRAERDILDQLFDPIRWTVADMAVAAIGLLNLISIDLKPDRRKTGLSDMHTSARFEAEELSLLLPTQWKVAATGRKSLDGKLRWPVTLGNLSMIEGARKANLMILLTLTALHPILDGMIRTSPIPMRLNSGSGEGSGWNAW